MNPKIFSVLADDQLTNQPSTKVGLSKAACLPELAGFACQVCHCRGSALRRGRGINQLNQSQGVEVPTHRSLRQRPLLPFSPLGGRKTRRITYPLRQFIPLFINDMGRGVTLT
jgi:hypothetical protein